MRVGARVAVAVLVGSAVIVRISVAVDVTRGLVFVAAGAFIDIAVGGTRVLVFVVAGAFVGIAVGGTTVLVLVLAAMFGTSSARVASAVMDGGGAPWGIEQVVRNNREMAKNRTNRNNFFPRRKNDTNQRLLLL